MIVLRTRPNTLVLPLIQGTGVANDQGMNTVYIYPGLNGNVPESVKDHPMFKEQVAEGYLIIKESKAKEVDETSNAKIDDVNGELLETVVNSTVPEAVKMVKSIFKLVDLEAIEKKETRSKVLAAINEQKKTMGYN